MAAFGGCLVLGALPRIVKHQGARDALIMAVGLVVLANTRPYEGLVLSLGVAVALLAWVTSQRGPAMEDLIFRSALPIASVLLLAGVAMGYYFWRVTGSPFHMPYLVAKRTVLDVPSVNVAGNLAVLASTAFSSGKSASYLVWTPSVENTRRLPA